MHYLIFKTGANMRRKLPLYITSTEEVKLYHATVTRQVNNTITSERLAGNDN